MKRKWVILAAVMAVVATDAEGQRAERDHDAEIRAAIMAARSAAGSEHLGTFARLCVYPPSAGAPSTADNVPGYVTNPASAPPRESWYAPPARIFDDMYWLGGSVHSAWLIDTGDGYVLIDTQFPYNSGPLILDGMRGLGLDPADIRYIIISHAHADHIGGVELVQDATDGAAVIMGAADWDLVNTYPNRFRSMTPDRENRISVGDDPYELRLGDQTIHIIPTPGHTPGTLSYIFTVHDFGRPVTVAYSGGTAFNFQTDTPDPGIPNLQRYLASQETFAARALDAGASVVISNHSDFDDAHDKTRMLAGRGFGPNPFVSSVESVQRYFRVMTECTRAKIIDLEKMLEE